MPSTMMALTISIVEVTEVEPGLGEEAVEEAGPVLHLPEPGLDQRGQLILCNRCPVSRKQAGPMRCL